MSKKSPRILELMRGCEHPVWDAHYVAYFACFNRELYYEAHDVLEELWLAEGKAGARYGFYKGLIQAAGAFVHLKLHHASPSHRVHGQRLAPASRLLRLALTHTTPYLPVHQDLDVTTFQAVCRDTLAALESTGCRTNPWSPGNGPRLRGPGQGT